MTRSEARRLQASQARLRQLAAELAASPGFVSPGSVVRRFMRCGKPNCRCRADPPQLHGPYWQWTRAVNGKTITRNLTEEQARLYQEWIANRRRLTRILAEMDKVSERAATILLQQADGPDADSGQPQERHPKWFGEPTPADPPGDAAARGGVGPGLRDGEPGGRRGSAVAGREG